MKKRNKLILILLILCMIGGTIYYVLRSDLITSLAANKVSTNTTVPDFTKSGNVYDNNMYEGLEAGKVQLAQTQKVYTVSYSAKISKKISTLKKSSSYTLENPLLIHNPYGTNTLSLYVYFTTDENTQTSYTIKASGCSTFSGDVNEEYTKTHEFTIIGLNPNKTNTITITTTTKDNTKKTKTFTYKMGSLLGWGESKLTETETSKNLNTSSTKLASGLYAVIGNNSTVADYTFYYDKDGYIRGEIPLLEYNSARICFYNGYMYYGIEEETIVKINNLGQVIQVYNTTSKYEFHHDYAIDSKGNIIALATILNTSRRQDAVIKFDGKTGKITGVADFKNIMGDYYKKTSKGTSTEDDRIEWLHFNTIQLIDDDNYILSSRETSTIFKVSSLFDNPSIDYMIGEEDFWKDTKYVSKLLSKIGSVGTLGGQHSVTYQTSKYLKKGQYYLYLFDNNYGSSVSRTDYNWKKNNYSRSTDTFGTKGTSRYIKYLVDENKKSVKIVSTFNVPYSGIVSSAQDSDNGTIYINSGTQGLLSTYTKSGKLLKQYKVKKQGLLVYRSYNYTFKGFYFR